MSGVAVPALSCQQLPSPPASATHARHAKRHSPNTRCALIMAKRAPRDSQAFVKRLSCLAPACELLDCV